MAAPGALLDHFYERLLYWRKLNTTQTIAFIDITQDMDVLLCAASKVLDA
jgi:hypothetical protein